MESLEDLLAQVKAECGAAPPSNAVISPQTITSPSLPKSSACGSEDNLLQELRAEFAERDRLEHQQREHHLQEEQRQQQQVQQQRREALSQQAQAWLQALEPLSTEGLWFQGFASSYPSHLEAAIDYLEALQANANEK